MSSALKNILTLCLLTCLAVGTVGCSGNAENKSKKTDDKGSAESDANKTTSVLPEKSTTESSPAAVSIIMPGPESTPDEVCASFMAYLQSGDRANAEKLLTRTASNVTNQADWQIPPLGGPNAQYRSKGVSFATNKKRLAQAEFKIFDSIDGKTNVSEITWMMRKKPNGWRIFGMLLQVYEDAPKDLISFENPIDVTMIKGVLSAQETSVASNPDPSVTTK